ncbi:MAG: hypothetical protein KC621_23480 [Myxococcales bacterium]|nr:hypothetical protein [Myxococcales bacterium]
MSRPRFLRSPSVALLPLLVVALPGCDAFFGSGGHGDDDDDSGYSTPTYVPPGLDCRDEYVTPDPGNSGLPACVTDTISCGSTIQGTVAGGSTVFSNESGMAWEWCSGHSTGTQLAGPERVYRLDVDSSTTYVTPRLRSCEPLQLLWYQTSQACPTDHVLCSYITVDGSRDQSDDILLAGNGTIWFVVEGISGTSGNFELTVECGGT